MDDFPVLTPAGLKKKNPKKTIITNAQLTHEIICDELHEALPLQKLISKTCDVYLLTCNSLFMSLSWHYYCHELTLDPNSLKVVWTGRDIARYFCGLFLYHVLKNAWECDEIPET